MEYKNLALTQGQKAIMAELEFIHTTCIRYPEYGLFAFIIGEHGVGVNTAVEAMAAQYQLPLLVQPATSWIVKGARSEPHSLTRLGEALNNGPLIFVLDQFDQLRRTDSDGGWFQCVTMEVYSLLSGKFKLELSATAKHNMAASMIVVTAHGSTENLDWLPGNTFRYDQSKSQHCLPSQLTDLLPEPFFAESPNYSDWAVILKPFQLGAMLDSKVSDALDNPQGLYWLRKFVLNRMRDQGQPELNKLLSEQQVSHLPIATPVNELSKPEEASLVLTAPLTPSAYIPNLDEKLEEFKPLCLDFLARTSNFLAGEYSDPFPTQNTTWEIKPLLMTPLAFYGLQPGKKVSSERTGVLETYLLKVVNRLLMELEDKVAKTLSPELLSTICAFPEIMNRIPDQVEIPASLMSLLCEHAYYVHRWAHTAKDITEKATLDKFLLQFPEYIFYGLEQDQKQLQPTNLFFSSSAIIPPSLLPSMSMDPFWIYKWFSENPAALSGSGHVLKQWQELLRSEDYNAHQLYFKHLLFSGYAIPETSQLPQLATSPQIAIELGRRFPEIPSELLSSHIVESPMWVYNWLAITRRERTSEMLTTLLKSPPWCIQYVTDLQPSDALGILNRSRQLNTNPFWSEWLSNPINVTQI